MELTADQLDTLTCTADEVGGEVTTDYLYGVRCVAVTFDGTNTAQHAADLFFRLTLNDADLAAVLTDKRLATDNIGFGAVIYWPTVTAGTQP